MLAALALCMTMNRPAEPKLVPSASLQVQCDKAVRAVMDKFQGDGLVTDKLALTVVRVASDSQCLTASVRGDVSIYPASVVKLCYLAYGAHQLQAGKIKLTPEIERQFTDMIVESDNDATGAVVDLLTGTTSGPELAPKAFQEWSDRRQVVNKWFASRGYQGIYACQKTWYSGPYGRERQSYGASYENRNKLTTNATARLMLEVKHGAIADEKWTTWMLAKLSRKNPADFADADGQAKNYIGGALPKGAKLWSKAGWTSTARHDCAYVELPSGEMLVIVIFTEGVAAQTDIIPTLAKELIARVTG